MNPSEIRTYTNTFYYTYPEEVKKENKESDKKDKITNVFKSRLNN